MVHYESLIVVQYRRTVSRQLFIVVQQLDANHCKISIVVQQSDNIVKQLDDNKYCHSNNFKLQNIDHES